MTRDAGLPVLGWKEQVALPDWGVGRLRAKLDTGARTSALHVESLAVVAGGPGDPGDPPLRVRFEILVGSRDDPDRRTLDMPVAGFRVVRDSGANQQRRPVVCARVVCGPVDVVTEVTITDRSGMNFRLLLGRLALAGTCLVDPGRGYLVSPKPPSRRRGRP